MNIESCSSLDMEVTLYTNEESNSIENGYFSGLRVFKNKDTGETLIFPYLMLPTLSSDEVASIYKTLFNDELCSVLSEFNFFIDFENGLNDGFEPNGYEENNYIKHLNSKNTLERAIGRIMCVYSAVEAIRIAENILEIDIDSFRKKLAKSIARFFISGLETKEAIDRFDVILKKLCNNICNNSIFNFANYINRINVPENTAGEFNEIVKRAKSLQGKNYKEKFGLFADCFSEKDVGSNYRHPPCPTLKIINASIDGESNVVFGEVMVAFLSICEDGEGSIAVYAENTDFENYSGDYFVASYFQDGELSFLIFLELFGFGDVLHLFRKIYVNTLFSSSKSWFINNEITIKPSIQHELYDEIAKITQQPQDLIEYLFESSHIRTSDQIPFDYAPKSNTQKMMREGLVEFANSWS